MDRLPGRAGGILSADDLLAGGAVVHDIPVPAAVLRPAGGPEPDGQPGRVRLRPLNVGVLTVISRAARDDSSLVPLLMIKEALVEPAMSLEAIRCLHVGLVHYLVAQINHISGLTVDGELPADAVDSPSARMHLLLARHFGWTPEQVSHLTPGQVAVYLTGIEKLLEREAERR